MIQQPNFNYYSNPYFQNYNTPVIQQSQPVFNPIMADYYRNLIESKLPKTLQEVHDKYFPDLTYEEFNMSKEERNDYLYKNGKLEQLAKYGTDTNCGGIYNRIKDNQDFKELINSKYLNTANGFVRIINNLNTLEEKRQEKLKYNPNSYPSPYYVNVMKLPFNYYDYDMPDYLRMLNDFSKNEKLSDDLKQYYLFMKSDNLELYYTKLNKLNNSNNPIDILTEKNHFVKE